MNRFFAFVLALTMAVACGQNANNSREKERVPGRPKQEKPESHQDWQERMQAEKIGFLTTEVGLTSAEAEKFWPVYNEYQQRQWDSFGKVGETYNMLDEAVKAKNSDEVIAALVKSYLEAQDAANSVETEAMGKYSEIISETKVAKLILAEEKFRRQQIHRLHRRDREK